MVWLTGRRAGRGRRLLVAVGLVAVIAGCDGTVTALFGARDGDAGAGDAGTARIDGTVLAAMTALLRAGQAQDVVVTLHAATAPPALGPNDRAALETLARGLERDKERLLARPAVAGTRVVQHFSQLPSLHLRVESETALRALADAPEIARLEPNRTYTTFATPANLELIGQPAAAAGGKLGSGTVVVIDTGADHRRSPFNCSAPGPHCRIVHAADFAPDDRMADDARAHGTNVAGIVAATAPGARIVALDVFDGNIATTTTILAAINWSIENRARHDIVALNMSFGGGAFAAPCTIDALAIAIATARTRGILSVVASGNDGKTGALASPACSSQAISVGAVYDTAIGKLATEVCTDASSARDQVACFSNAASFLHLLAPGVAVRAAGLTMSGTSQAAPHVAGAIAVLRAAFPGESLDALVTRLTSSGRSVRDARNGLVKPRLDLAAALAKAPLVAPPPPPPPAPPKPPPSGAITLNGGARHTRNAIVSAAVSPTSGTPAQICVTTATSCPGFRSYVPSVVVTLPGGDGSKTVRVWWRDAAGNTSSKPNTASITLDTTPPQGGKLNVKIAGKLASYSWVGVRDHGSGVASYRLLFRNDAPVPDRCTVGSLLWQGGARTVTQELLPGKLYYARLCAVDAVGNVAPGIAGQFETAP